jgi:hypothetical protein
MIARNGLPHARARPYVGVACALLVLAVLFPTSASAAGKTTTTTVRKLLGISIPASARVHGTTPTSTTPAPAPAATTPAAVTPAAVTPAGGVQPGGVQPGTVAPPTTAPATTVPPAATTPAATVPPTATPTSPPGTHSTTVVGVARKANSKGTRLSTGALALAVLGALLALGCLVWVLARWLALEPRWTVSLMHSLREASYRGSATWAEFSDWARLGR